MYALDTTSDVVRVVTTTTANIAVEVAWSDLAAGGTVTPGGQIVLISSATTTTVIAAPGAGVTRAPMSITVTNTHASSPNTVSIQHYDGTNSAPLFPTVSMAAGEQVAWQDGAAAVMYDANGRIKQVNADSPVVAALSTPQIIQLDRNFSAAKAAGSPQSGWLSAPNAGSASPVYTAGSGYTCSRSTTGALVLTNAVTKNRLAQAVASLSVAGTLVIYDRLWSCSGMGFAASTYTITTPGSLPARVTDNGAGCEAFIEQFVAAGAASGTAVLNYTNAAGSNVSATIAAVASAPVAGQIQRFPFTDGIRSATSVVTSATWTSGSFGLTIARRLLDIPCPVANVATVLNWAQTALREVPVDACLMLALIPTATTAAVAVGSASLIDQA